MDNEQFIRLVRDPYVGLLVAAEVTARNLLPDGLFTDRQKMAGLVRELTETALDDLTPIAQDIAVQVVNTTAPPGTGLVTLTEPPPPPPTEVFDVDAIVGEFISNTYGPGAILDPAYKTEIDWVRDQLTDAARDQLLYAQQEWIQSIVQSVGRTYNWKVADVGQAMPEVKGYQRIARPGACVFCRVVALNQYTTFGDEGGYHKNCQCYAVPIFFGQPPYRPDYYDEFERQYNEYRDKPPGDDYNARELRTPPKRRPDGTLIPDPAEERRRETFRNIRAGIKAEQFPAVELTPEEVFGVMNVLRSQIHGEFFSMAEIDALSAYAGDEYMSINDILRGKVSGQSSVLQPNRERIDALNRLFERTTATRDLEVWRGTNIDRIVKGISDFSPEDAADYTQDLVGRLISDPGLFSTSRSFDVGQQFASNVTGGRLPVIMNIEIPRGSPMIEVGQVLSTGKVELGPWTMEREVLLPPGTNLRIWEITANGTDYYEPHLYIRAEVVGPGARESVFG